MLAVFANRVGTVTRLEPKQEQLQVAREQHHCLGFLASLTRKGALATPCPVHSYV
jgi:hypothetical protein